MKKVTDMNKFIFVRGIIGKLERDVIIIIFLYLLTKTTTDFHFQGKITHFLFLTFRSNPSSEITITK